jgi:hypothetical protein
MLRHVVMWTFLDQAEGQSRQENLAKVKQALLALRPQVPEILDMEIGVDSGVGRDPWDMVLIMSFADAAALDRYQKHPEHKKISAFVGKVRQARACVDFYVT